jgi:aryl-alcohol dehydrogenase-like predicted oxidoreductase
MAAEHGQGLEESLVADALGSRRKDVVIATKFGQAELLGRGPDGSLRMSDDTTRQGASRRWITQAVEESLTRLRTDYIDLYQPHVLDATVPREETLRALDDLVRSGKVRAIGEAATFATAADLVASLELQETHGLVPFVSIESHYNLLVRDAETSIIPGLRQRGMSLLPYFPLANGLLTGKYRADVIHPSGSRYEKIPALKGFLDPAHHWAKVEALRQFAAVRGITMVELAIGWLLSEPVVASVIAGATMPEQVRQNAAAAHVVLGQADRAEIDRLLAAA